MLLSVSRLAWRFSLTPLGALGVWGVGMVIQYPLGFGIYMVISFIP